MSDVNKKFVDALSCGLVQAMKEDKNIFVTGIAVDYQSGIFGSTVEALRKFGPERVFDAPAMENALQGIAIGAAAMGKRPVIVHARCDFMFLAFDQLLNLASKWQYMYGGNAGNMPVVVRGIIGRGWGQGATHSQSIHATLAHFPGLIVAMPATSQAAQDIIYTALKGNNPVVILEHRSLYNVEGTASKDAKLIEFGKADIVQEGTDITIVATSMMVHECISASKELAKHGLSVEIIDPRTIRPLDEKTILESVAKTGRLLTADVSWELYGFASEVTALVCEKSYDYLKAAPRRISNADCPAPVSAPLEGAFYPTSSTIVNVVSDMFGADFGSNAEGVVNQQAFKGPY